MWQRVSGYADPAAAAFNPFDASIASGTDRTNLVKVGGQWTHLFGGSVEGNINGGYVQSFAAHSGIVATVTGDGTVVPTIGNQGWFEYGGRLGFRISKGWVADLFVNGTLVPSQLATPFTAASGCGRVIRPAFRSRRRLALIRPLQAGDIELDHLQHRLHRPLGSGGIGTAQILQRVRSARFARTRHSDP